MREHDEKELVTYGFLMAIGTERHEISGTKTLKLFKSWFRLTANWQYRYMPKDQRRTLLVGYVKFEDGETWIWQNKKYARPGGWQIALDPTPTQIKLF